MNGFKKLLPCVNEAWFYSHVPPAELDRFKSSPATVQTDAVQPVFKLQKLFFKKL